MSDSRPSAGLFARLRPPPATRLVARAGLALLAVFTLTRVLFYALHGDKVVEASVRDVALSFLIGLRFDLAAMAVLLAPLVLVAHLPVVAPSPRLMKRLALPLFVLVGAAATLTALGDCIYYAWSAKRISYEPMVLFVAGGELLEFAFGEHPVLLPALLLALVAVWLAIWRRLARSAGGLAWDLAWHRTRAALSGVFALGVLFVLARGSLAGPLRIGDAYFTIDVLVNHATLNPLYTFFFSTVDDRSLHDLMPEAEAVEVVRGTVVHAGAGSAQFLSDDYPLEQRVERPDAARRWNVVILIMESLSAETMGAFGDKNDATPRMDALIAESVLFDRFLASGSRSSNGLAATLLSVPAQLGRPVTHTAMMLDNFRSLAHVLGEQGYESTFIYGGVYDFRNAEGFLRNAGYDTIIGEPLDAGAERRAWGYDDDAMFDRLFHEMKTRTRRPQFMTLFTQNLHGRDVPEEYVEMRGRLKYGKKLKNSRYYNLLDYTDWCVGRFFERARQQSFYSETIFVITSDHTNHKNPSLYGNRRIPLIIHAPWLLAPARHHTTGGQCDVLPTVLGLLSVSTEHAAFGRDLLAVAAAGEPGHAYFTYGETIGWVEGPWLIQDLFDADRVRLYNVDDDPRALKNVEHLHPGRAREMSRKARATLQLSRQLLFENRLYLPHGRAAVAGE